MSQQERHLHMYQQIFNLMLEADKLNLPHVVTSRRGFHAVEFTFDTTDEQYNIGKQRMDYRIGRMEISVDDAQNVVDKIQEAFRKVRQMDDEYKASAAQYEEAKQRARTRLSVFDTKILKLD